MFHRDLFDDETERHDVVGHRECIGVTQIDFVLARSIFVERILNGNAHGFKNQQCARAQIAGDIGSGEIEVRTGVQWHQRFRRVTLGEIKEFHFGCSHEREAAVMGFVEVALQYLSRVALKWRVVVVENVAEHSARDF